MRKLVVGLGCVAVSLCAQAQDNEIQSPINGHYYSLIPAQITADPWGDQAAIAEANGGFLVTIRSAEENQWLVDTFGPMTNDDDANTGLNDIDVEGTFVWHSGEPVTYTNWNAGEPNNSGNEDIMELDLSDGGWNDNGTSSVQVAIMERIVFEFRRNPTGGGFIEEGEDVVLEGEAWGNTGPISYQWQKNGSDLVGETGTMLVLNDVTSADSGSYTLVATDSSKASIVSDPASITVVAPGSLPVGGIIATSVAGIALALGGVTAMARRRRS